MTIFRKIFGVFLLLIFLGFTMGLLGIYHVYRLNQITRSILVEDLLLKQLETRLMDTFLSQVRYERQSRILGDVELVPLFDERGERFGKVLDQIEGMAAGEELKEHTARLRDVHHQYSQLFHQSEGETQQVEQQKVLFNEITRTLQEMIAESERLLREKIEKSDLLAQSTMDQTLMILGLVVILGIGTALFLAKRITHPIKELRKAATAFSYGAFDYPLTIRSKDEIGILTNAFTRMAEKLKEADRLKENFISDITHELKTPMTSLTEAVHLLREEVAGPITEKQLKLLVIIDEDTKRLQRMINDLLDLSRIRAGMLKLQVEPGDLGGIAREAVAFLSPIALKKGLQLKLVMEKDPGLLMLDENRIYQVFTNLISNALKFTPPGGEVTVSIKEHSSDEIQVSVADTGIGISKEGQQRIFDRFYQLETDLPRRGSGFGLGLAIARHNVQAHDGRIWVESEPQQGSTFTFTLPKRRGSHPMRNEGSPAVNKDALTEPVRQITVHGSTSSPRTVI